MTVKVRRMMMTVMIVGTKVPNKHSFAVVAALLCVLLQLRKTELKLTKTYFNCKSALLLTQACISLLLRNTCANRVGHY